MAITSNSYSFNMKTITIQHKLTSDYMLNVTANLTGGGKVLLFFTYKIYANCISFLEILASMFLSNNLKCTFFSSIFF